ncbi:hypothetical protein J3E72DRAFT_182298 [Bipolaris maydis]|nr:hypothetical protein J3E72DRAFT_182298 [Bipolaris maydis]
MTNLYHHGQTQLQNMYNQLHTVYNQLQVTQNNLENTRRQMLAAEKELQREREASELLHQEFSELQECHDKLIKQYDSCVKVQEDLNKSATDSRMLAYEVARQAESLLENSPANLAGGGMNNSENGQSISRMLLESAKNALLVHATSSQHLEDEGFTKFRNFIDENVELREDKKTLSQQVEDGRDEIASLKKALEIATEDRQRKKSRRGKTLAGKNQ